MIFKISSIKTLKTYFTSCLILFILVHLCFSCKSPVSDIQSTSKPEQIEIINSNQHMTVDGNLDEAIYQHLKKYYLKNSITGAVIDNADYLCYFTIHHDQESLFMSFSSYDQNIYSFYKNRDDHLWKEECVEVFIDTDDHSQNYVEIEVSPAGVLFDSFIVDPNNIDVDQTAAYDLQSIQFAVSVDGILNDSTSLDKKWTIEFSIKLNELDKAFNPKNSKWNMNFYRINRDKAVEKYYAYSPTFGSFHKPSQFVDCIFAE